MVAKTFSFRLDAQGAEQVMAAFKGVAGQSDELRAAYEKLIASSPQLASVHDGVKAKLRDTAEGLKKTREESGTLAGTFTRAGILGLAIGAGTQAFQSLVEAVKDAYNAIPQAGDAAKQTVARFTTLTGSADLARGAYERLSAIARTTGASFGDTADGFQRFSVAAKDIGATSDQVLRLVEGIQKFAVVSGTSGPSMGAAVTQLGQALASGRLQGDELRSILENMPQLAQALARELHVSMGALRQMGSDGKLSSEEVFPALLRAVEGVDAKFKEMPVSIERGMNSAKTATNQLLAYVDSILGLSTSIATKWERIAGLMDRARGGLGGATAAENEAARLARISEIEQRLSAVGPQLPQRDDGYSVQIGTPRPGRPPDNVTQMRAELERLKAEQLEYQRDQRELRAVEREAALQAGREGARSRLIATRDELLELNPVFKATKTRDEELRQLDQVFRTLGLTRAQYDATAKAIQDKYVKALEAAKGTEKEGVVSVYELIEARRKLGEQTDKLLLEFDKEEASFRRLKERLDLLDKGIKLYQESGGSRGIAPDKAGFLTSEIWAARIKDTEELARSGQKADSTFQQFFANAASGFEDALVRGKSFRDVLQGIEQDIARIILRKSLLEPLTDTATKWFDGQGGASGIATSIGNWFKSFFADGGIMTDRGPLDLPIRTYAGGGVANSPQVAIFGEGRMPEAYVPLPDGRSIPVTMRNGGGAIRGGDVTVNVTNTNAAPAQIAAAVRIAVDRSHRELIDQVNRGGAMAKAVGRRR